MGDECDVKDRKSDKDQANVEAPIPATNAWKQPAVAAESLFHSMPSEKPVADKPAEQAPPAPKPKIKKENPWAGHKPVKNQSSVNSGDWPSLKDDKQTSPTDAKENKENANEPDAQPKPEGQQGEAKTSPAKKAKKRNKKKSAA